VSESLPGVYNGRTFVDAPADRKAASGLPRFLPFSFLAKAAQISLSQQFLIQPSVDGPASHRYLRGVSGNFFRRPGGVKMTADSLKQLGRGFVFPPAGLSSLMISLLRLSGLIRIGRCLSPAFPGNGRWMTTQENCHPPNGPAEAR
jgi:hypothetical protein